MNTYGIKAIKLKGGIKSDIIKKVGFILEDEASDVPEALYKKLRGALIRHEALKEKAMALLDPSAWGLDDSVEPIALPDGTEAKLRILDVSKGTDRNGLPYIMPRFEAIDEPTSKDFTDFLHLPNPDKMDAKRLNQVRNRMKNFLSCFEIDISRPFDPEDDLAGCEGWAILSLREDSTYGPQNGIKKYLIPN